MTTAAAETSTKMEMKENQSIVDEGTGTTRLITKNDGSKVPYQASILRESLQCKLDGLNQEFIDIDIILNKVASGLYNGKL